MIHRTMEEVMSALGDGCLAMFDGILRTGHAKYVGDGYSDDVRLDHDPRAQAACIYSHVLAEANKQFDSDTDIRHMEIRGLNLWIFERVDVVVRFKKMSDTGEVRSYQTQQTEDFDHQLPIEGLPISPFRLRVGYLLDETNHGYVRTQISAPNGRRVQWCAGIHSPDVRVEGKALWFDVSKQVQAFGT